MNSVATIIRPFNKYDNEYSIKNEYLRYSLWKKIRMEIVREHAFINAIGFVILEEIL